MRARGWIMAFFGLAACEGPAVPTDAPSTVDLLPAQVRLADDHVDVGVLTDDALCVDCHRDAVAQHAVSAHARSSFDNPWYRAVVDRLRAEVGPEASRHCAGCHDPVMLVAGAMDRPIEPNDPLTRVGVGCLVCHGIVETRTDGNGSYTLSSAPVPIPDPNDDDAIAAHRARLAPGPLRTPGLCGSCHRGFLGTHTGGASHLPGLDEIGPWRGSAWGGQDAQRIDDVPPTECRGCHMPPEALRTARGEPSDVFEASHRFAGGHGALAAQTDDTQLAAVLARQRSAATIDVAALVHEDGRRALPAERARVTPGERVSFDVVVRNVDAGHVFPGGARDLRDHWIEVRVRDARGATVAEAGTAHETRDDPSAFLLRTAMLDADGRIEREHLVHRFRALGWDHTIAPRDARAARYVLTVPEHEGALTIEATLRARRHHAGIHALACESTRSERGRAFDAAARRAGIPPLDGCAPELAFAIATTRVTLGEPSARATWSRLYEHGLALLHDVSERIDDARPSLERALAEAPTPRDRARVLLELARLDGSLGRVDDALARTAEVEATIGPHPAIDRVRGEAFERVWRWSDAAEAYARVARAAPLDTAAHRDRARASSAAGNLEDALAASASGLALLPRDEGLLRTLALVRGDEVSTQAYLAHRRPDDETALRTRCDTTEPRCIDDRLPIPTFELRALPPEESP